MANKFNVFATKSFERDLKKLFRRDKRIAEIYHDCVEILHDDPFNYLHNHDVKKLTNIKEGEGQWRIRFSSYRVRYDIINGDVVLHSVDHRKDIYK